MESIKKVCHISTVHTRDDTRIFQKECISLQENGYDVSFLIADGFGDEIQKNINIYDIGKASNKFSRMFLSVPKMLKKALVLKQDLYHFHDPELIPIGLILKLFGKKVIYDIHEDVPVDIMTKEWISEPLRKIIATVFKIFENRSLKFFDATITVAEHMNVRYKKYNNYAYIVRNFPLLSEFPDEVASFENRNKQICYVGSITAVRGAFAMVRAAEDLKYPFFLGGDIRGEQLKKDLELEKGWNNINYIGRLSRSQVADIMSKSMIGLALIQNDDNLANGYPVKLFEYMASGLPVIVSDFPKWREIVESTKSGIVVDQFNKDEIVTAIKKIIEDVALAEEYGKNGRNAVETLYSWNAEEKVLLEVYEKLFT